MQLLHTTEIQNQQTQFSVIVATADALSASRPGARRESLENYIKRLQKLEEIANEHKGVEKTFAIQAGREIRRCSKTGLRLNEAESTLLVRNIVNASSLNSNIQAKSRS